MPRHSRSTCAARRGGGSAANIRRGAKVLAIFFVALLNSFAVGQADVPRPNLLKLKPCGQWTDADFLTAVMADVMKDSDGQEFLAAFDATFPIPENALTNH